MDEKKIDLAKYRMERAAEKIEIAKYSLGKGLYISSLSNSYYSIFHSTRALFAFEEIDSKTHPAIAGFICLICILLSPDYFPQK